MSRRAGKSKIHRTRPASGRMRRLWDRLTELGFTRFKLWWEPMGPALEKCGHSGGYMMEDKHGMCPLGLSLDEALRAALGHAAYCKAFHWSGDAQ